MWFTAWLESILGAINQKQDSKLEDLMLHVTQVGPVLLLR